MPGKPIGAENLKMSIPTTIDLKYSSHARDEWSDTRGFIKNPPKKFFKFYNKHTVQNDGTVKAEFPFVHDKRYNLILIIDIQTGLVITNYLKLKSRNESVSNQSRILSVSRKR